MSSAPQKPVIQFGVFELDLAARQLRKNGTRVKLQDQPFRVLQLLLERPGEIVTREELREKLWSDDTFVEFDHSLNTAIQKIRQALRDSAGNPRFIETVPRVGYRFLAPVEGRSRAADVGPYAGGRQKMLARAAVACAVVVLFLLAAAAVLWTEQPLPPQQTLRQLTFDPGLSAWPDISSDGRFLVFSSDRDGGNDLDLWLLQVDGGEPVQLTDQPGDEHSAHFSPDGTEIVYKSSSDQSAYIISTLAAGQPRLVARGARYARFSPDGKRLAFAQDQGPGRVALVVTDSSGENPQTFGSDRQFFGIGLLWLPDGRLLANATPYDDLGKGEWYLVQFDGQAPRPTGILESVRRQGLRPVPPPPPFPPLAWLALENAVIFRAQHGDSTSLWKQPISLDSGKPAGPAQLVTSGAAMERTASAAVNGRIVYSDTQENIDLWLLPLDSESGSATGPPKRLTHTTTAETWPQLSPDGKTLAYLSSPSVQMPNLLRKVELYVTQLDPFSPSALFSGGPRDYWHYLVFGDDKKSLTYGVRENGEWNMHAVAPQEGTPTPICSDCRFYDGSSDGLFFVRGERGNYGFDVFDPASGERHPFLDSLFPIYNPRLSSDDRWVVFRGLPSGTVFRQIFMAPFRKGEVTRREEWIAITEPDRNSFHPKWSPRDGLIYYFSDQNGSVGIWAQPLDPRTKEPAGAPRAVYVPETGDSNLPTQLASALHMPQMTVGPGAIVFNMVEMRGNIWMLEPVEETQ